MKEAKTTVSIALTMVALLVGMAVVPAHAEEDADVPRAENLRVGYVNLDYLLERFKPYRDAQQEMIEYEQQLREEIEAEEQELQQMRQQLEEGADMLSQEERQRRTQEFQQRVQRLQQQAQRSEQLLAERERELLTPVMGDLQEAVQAVGEARNYDVIERYDRGAESPVIWVNERVDATDAVLDHLDDQDMVLDDPDDVEGPEGLDDLEDLVE